MPRGQYARQPRKEPAMSAEEPRPDPRPEPRAALREVDPRAAASARAAQLRDHGPATDDGVDEYHIEPGAIPDGWTYEWKRRLVLNAEDPSYATQVARGGWEPVPAGRHPDMMPRGFKGQEIERKGMVLMERPAEITEEVRAYEKRKARTQVRAKEEQLGSAPSGQFERQNKDASLVKVKKTYEAMPAIPE